MTFSPSVNSPPPPPLPPQLPQASLHASLATMMPSTLPETPAGNQFFTAPSTSCLISTQRDALDRAARVCLQRDPRAVVVGAAVLVIPLGVVRTVNVIEAPRRLALAQVGGVGCRCEQAEGYHLCASQPGEPGASRRTTRPRAPKFARFGENCTVAPSSRHRVDGVPVVVSARAPRNLILCAGSLTFDIIMQRSA